MASLKAEKPAGTQSAGQVKKEPVKSFPQLTAVKPAPKKTELKPREPRKKTWEESQQMLKQNEYEKKMKPEKTAQI